MRELLRLLNKEACGGLLKHYLRPPARNERKPLGSFCADNFCKRSIVKKRIRWQRYNDFLQIIRKGIIYDGIGKSQI
jgi:hypothetical protein